MAASSLVNRLFLVRLDRHRNVDQGDIDLRLSALKGEKRQRFGRILALLIIHLDARMFGLEGVDDEFLVVIRKDAGEANDVDGALRRILCEDGSRERCDPGGNDADDERPCGADEHFHFSCLRLFSILSVYGPPGGIQHTQPVLAEKFENERFAPAARQHAGGDVGHLANALDALRLGNLDRRKFRQRAGRALVAVGPEPARDPTRPPCEKSVPMPT